MENTNLLQGHSDQEKGAYLATIASIATADRTASDEEKQSLLALCDAAGISEGQKQQVMQAAEDDANRGLQQNLEILKGSELKYSLIADLIAFAKSDSDYSEAEQQSVQNISQYLGLSGQQFAVLNEVADQAAAQPATTASPQSLFGGLEDKLKGAGINSSGLLKGLITIAAPMILTKILSNRFQRGQNNTNSGGLGGMFGGSSNTNYNNAGSGGLGSLLGGGGLGSVISMLNGGRGFGNAGSLLGSLFGGNR